MPKHSTYGRSGIMELTEQIRQLWQTGRTEINRITTSVYEELTKTTAAGSEQAALVRNYPTAFTRFLCAMDFLYGNTYEIVITGSPEQTAPFLEALRSTYIPGKVVVVKDPGDERIDKLTTYTRFYAAHTGRAAVYVCRAFQCSRPVYTVDEMLHLLLPTGVVSLKY